MKCLLLDVNVLVALLDPLHLHSVSAHHWFASRVRKPWATCPLSSNGALRVLSALEKTTPISELAEVFREFHQLPGATRLDLDRDFQPELHDESLFDLSHLRGRNQITDALLLATAVHHEAQLVTFDRNIPWRAVRRATPDHIHLLSS